MRTMSSWFSGIATLLVLTSASSAQARGDSIEVRLDTSSLAGSEATLAFDLIDGDGALGTALTLSWLDVVDGSLGAVSYSGNASGDPAIQADIGDLAFFNELLQNAALGSAVNFRMDFGSLVPPGALVPDALSVFLLDPLTGQTLIDTELPGDALLTLDLAGSFGALVAGTQLPTDPLIQVTATSVPEPASTSQLAAAGLILALLARRTASRARVRRARLPVLVAALLAVIAASAQHAAAQTPVAVDDLAATSISGLVLDRATGNFVAQVSVINASPQTLGAPLSVAVTSLSTSGVTLANASGTGAQGSPYIAVPLPPEGLIPGAEIVVPLAFANPTRAHFSFATSVQAVPLGGGATLPSSVRLPLLGGLASVAGSVRGQPLAAQHAALANYVSQHPEFSESGVNGTDFWAIFSDGREVIVADNRGRDESPVASPMAASSAPLAALPAAGPAATGLPFSNRARLVLALGGDWEDAGRDVGDMLIHRVYDARLVGGSVEEMKQIGGEGVLYINSHGGAGRSTPNGVDQPFALYTSTKVTAALEETYRVDLAAGRLRQMCAPYFKYPDVGGDPKDNCHYAITAKFVEHYWTRFSQNSLVFIDACRSDSIDATDFRKAVIAMGASVYMGWTGSVGDIFAARTARLVFDRLLGANRSGPFFYPEDSPQRPFPWPDVLQDLPNHGLAENNGTQLSISTCENGCQTEFGLLAPSIEFILLAPDVLIDPLHTQAWIYGSFGEDPGGAAFGGSQRAVLIDGVEAPIQSWSADSISVTLPATGAGSAGKVLVRVRDHVSNGAMISEWHGRMTLVAHDSQYMPLTATIVHEARIRADVRATRHSIHSPPAYNPAQYGSIAGTRYSWSCKGTAVHDDIGSRTEITWSGQQGLRSITKFELGVVTFTPVPSLSTYFTVPSGDHCIFTQVTTTDGVSYTYSDDVDLGHFTSPYEPLDLILDENYGILGRSIPDATDSGDATTLTFPNVPNSFPPDPAEGR